MIREVAAGALALLLCVFVVACGDDEQGGVPTQVPLPSVSPSVELAAFTSSILPYSLSVPRDWTHEAAGPGVDRFYAVRPEGTLVSEITVRCSRTIVGGETDFQSLVDEDLSLLDASPVGVSDPVITDIAGVDRPGKMMVYGHGVTGVRVNTMVAYFSDDSCGWRVRMNVFGGGSTMEFQALFEQIAASMNPAEAVAAGG
jgi:hypothetical protein